MKYQQTIQITGDKPQIQAFLRRLEQPTTIYDYVDKFKNGVGRKEIKRRLIESGIVTKNQTIYTANDHVKETYEIRNKPSNTWQLHSDYFTRAYIKTELSGPSFDAIVPVDFGDIIRYNTPENARKNLWSVKEVSNLTVSKLDDHTLKITCQTIERAPTRWVTSASHTYDTLTFELKTEPFDTSKPYVDKSRINPNATTVVLCKNGNISQVDIQNP